MFPTLQLLLREISFCLVSHTFVSSTPTKLLNRFTWNFVGILTLYVVVHLPGNFKPFVIVGVVIVGKCQWICCNINWLRGHHLQICIWIIKSYQYNQCLCVYLEWTYRCILIFFSHLLAKVSGKIGYIVGRYRRF